MSDKISKNFTYDEFERSDSAIRLHIANTIKGAKVYDAIRALVGNLLQPLRDAWGRPMKINSGYRGEELNKAVGGVATSQHCKGEAADIATGSEIETYRMADLVQRLRLPFDQMILYPTFLHLSHRLDGKQRGQVLYNKTYNGRRL